jgi:outer membrane protein
MTHKMMRGMVLMLFAGLFAGLLAWPGQLGAQQVGESQSSTQTSSTNTGQAASESTASTKGANNIDYSTNRAFPNIFDPYMSPVIRDKSMSNSERLHSLIQNGKMELTLNDAMALALENNLDIEVSRYTLLYGKIDMLRTAGGGATRGTNPGLFGGVQAFAGSSSGGGTSSGGGGGLTGSSGAGSVGSFGCCDPFAGASFRWDRNTTPVNFTTVSGIPIVTNQTTSLSTFFGQGFLTGTSYAIGVGGTRQSTTSLGTLFNPEVPAGLTLGFSQNLLNGFGYRANAKYIRIAKNDLKQADTQFRQQVITTVANVANLYSDLVSFKENVRVAEQAVAYAEKLLADNKRQVEIGTLAPIEVVRAESEVATDEQALIVAQTSYQQQQELLKTALSKHVDEELRAAVIEPADKLPEPKPNDVPPLDEALMEAERNRPELVLADLNIRNQEITIEAARNGLLPSLSLFGTFAPTGLSGNQLVCPTGTSLSGSQLCSPGNLQPAIVHNGIWQALSQTFHGNYPDYTFGLSLQIPLRNRVAQADMTIALLQERMLRTQLQQQKNTIAQDVRNAEIGVTQARAQVAAAVKATQLANETFEAEKKKFQLGESTVFLVIQTQRDLATAEGNEVKARDTYAKALTTFDQATSTILDKFNIQLSDAKDGQYRRTPNIPGTHETAQQ